MNTQANCCSNPSLRIIEAIPHEFDAKVSVRRCNACKTYWQVVADQVVTEKGEVIAWDWFEPLSEGQAEDVLAYMGVR